MSEKVMTEETKKKLLGLMPMNQDATIDYTPEVFEELDIDSDFKPIFTIRAFTKGEISNFRSKSKSPAGVPDDYLKEMARRAVKSWDKFYNLTTGEKIECEFDNEGKIKKDIFDLVPEQTVMQIWKKISIISSILPSEKTGLSY